MVIYIICLIIFAIVYLFEYKEKQKNNSKPINWLLNTGIMLIILSSIILLTSSWKILSNNLKVLILFLGSFIYTGVGIYLKRKQNLEKTGNALTLVGTFVFSISTLSLSYYEILGDKFTLSGEYKFLMLGIASLIETILLIIRNKVLNKNNYVLSLLMFLGTIFTFVYQVSNNTLISLLGIALTLLIINIMKKILVQNDKYLKIINIVFIGIVITLFPLIGININNNYKYISVIGYIIFIVVIPLNYFFQIKDTRINFTTTIIETILLIYSLSVIKNSTVCGILTLLSSIIMMIMCLKSNEKVMKKSFLYGYIFQSTLSSIIFVLVQKYSFASLIITLINIFVLYNYINKDKILKIINGILEPINLYILILSLLRTITIIKELNNFNLLIILMMTLFIITIVYEIKNNKIYKIYEYLLLIGLAIIAFSSNFPTYFKIIMTIIDIGLVINNNIYCKKLGINFPIITALITIFNTAVLYSNNSYISSSIMTVILLISYMMNRQNEDRYYYIAMLYLPYVLTLNQLTNSTTIIHGSIVMPLLLFTRYCLHDIKKDHKFIIEIILMTLIGLAIKKPLEILLFLIILLIFNKQIIKEDSKTATKFNLFITLAITYYHLLFLGNQEKVIESLGLIIMMIFNQLENSINQTKNSNKLGTLNGLLLMIICYSSISNFELEPIIGALVLGLLVYILKFLYYDKINKEIVKSYIVVPIYYLLNIVTDTYVKEIIETFILLYPISLLLRRVFKTKQSNINLAESLIIGFMILQFIFEIDISVAITLGIMLLLITIIGFVFDYKAYSNVGLIGIILVVIVQTINLWNKMPWWLYLFIVGICLIAVSIVVEKRKDKIKIEEELKKESNI